MDGTNRRSTGLRALCGITLLVVLILGFAIVQYQAQKEVEVYKGRMRALQAILEGDGYTIEWHPDRKEVEYSRTSGPPPWGGGIRSTDISDYDS